MTTPATTPATIDHLVGPLYADLDYELEATRRMLAAVPTDRLDWRPHPKSMTLGRLASHVAEVPMLVTTALTTPEYDVAASGMLGGDTHGSTTEILARFDRSAAEMRAALAAATPDALAERWALRMGDTVFFREPRQGLVRGFGLSHLVHHRAQLGVYLRLLDVPVPGMYGPTADEAVGAG